MLNNLERKFHAERRTFWENRLNLKYVVAYSKINVSWLPTANALEIPDNIIFDDYCENPTENKHLIDCNRNEFYPDIEISVIKTHPQTIIHFWFNNKQSFITYPKITYTLSDFMKMWCNEITMCKMPEQNDFVIYTKQKMLWLFMLTFYDFYATPIIYEGLLNVEYVFANDYLVKHIIKY